MALHVPRLLFLSVLSLITQRNTASPTFVHNFCPNNTTFAPNSTYQNNLNLLLSHITSSAPQQNGFLYTTVGSSQADAIHGAFLCRGDDTANICRDCVVKAANDLPRKCPRGKVAIIWYDKCMIRYSNESFNGTVEPNPLVGLMNTTVNTNKNDRAFMDVLVKTVGYVVEQASNESEKRFFTGEAKYGAQTLYALAQCMPDLSTGHCYTCFSAVISMFPCNKSGSVLCPSCYISLAMNPFYQIEAAAPAPALVPITAGKSVPAFRRKVLSYIVILTVIPAAISILLISGIWIIKRRQKSLKISILNVDEINSVESLQFDFSTIKDATNNFSRNNKLGEGGFVTVYKGRLESGLDVAVKRLARNSGQIIEEFKTEILLVAKLQHRNLVKLLGFCLKTEEKILVYEFMCNSSLVTEFEKEEKEEEEQRKTMLGRRICAIVCYLDRLLFDPIKRASVQWETRLKITAGIAKGLFYLHEDSWLKIVHRDLKSSNILLDEAMNPKISDFGLAKLFGVDQTQDDTNRIVGTYGYMAPEYAMTGHLSVKSDVYSFGVIVLEIVSGQRNRVYNRLQPQEALLHRAWRLWREGAAIELVDSTLGNKFSSEEMTKCIHIGLLCIQEIAAARPKMASIVASLNGESITLPLPTPPHYFTGAEESSGDSLGAEGDIQGHRLDQCTTVFTGQKSITCLHPR